MTSYLRIFLITLIVISLPGQLLFADTLQNTKAYEGGKILTLEAAKKIALKNNPTLAAAMERIVQAKEKIKQSKAGYLPAVSIAAAWDHTDKTENTLPGYEESQYTNKISATQILFDGFMRKYSVLSATYGEKMNSEFEKESRRLLIWSVAQSYLNVQLASENMKIAESDMIFNEKQAREAVAKERAGTGSLSDVLNFETRVNSAKSSLIATNQTYKEAVYSLAALLGFADSLLPKGMKVTKLNNETIEKNIPCDLDKDIKIFVEQRSDIKQAYYSLKDSEAKISQVKAEFYPQISLTGAYGNSGDWDSISDGDNLAASVGINVSFNLFNGGSSVSKTKEARSEKRRMEKELENAKNLAVSEMRSAWDNIGSARQQLLLQEENADLVKKTRDLVEKEYKAGQVSLVRLNEAQNDLVASLGGLAKAKVSLILALEEFDYYTGRNILPEG